MKASTLLIALASTFGFAVAQQTNLYASSYEGTVYNLGLKRNKTDGFVLLKKHQDKGCGPSPSWLTLDYEQEVMYCLGEGIETKNGSITTYGVSQNGKLVQSAKDDVLGGPVSSVVYGGKDREKAVAIAH